MKYTPIKKDDTFAEDFQAINIEFALAKKDGKEKFKGLTAFSKCRDFLGDALFAEATKCKTRIYGFSYDGTGDPQLPKTYSCFALKFNDKEQQETFIKYYEYWETLFSMIAGTKKGYIKTDNDVCVVVSDKAWSHNNFGVSLYTFLLKGIVLQDKNQPVNINQFHKAILESKVTQYHWDNTHYDSPTKEAGYMKKISVDELEKAIRVIKKINKCPTTFGGTTYKDKNFDSSIHHSSGFVSTLQWRNNEFWNIYKEAS